MTAIATSLWRRLFVPKPVYAAVYLRIVMAVWTFAFVVPRLPYLNELYTYAPVMEPSALMTILHVPALPVWAVAVMFVVLLFASVGFAFGYHARALHVVILVMLVYLLGFDRYAIRGFGELALYQWIWLFFTPYDRLWDDKGRVVKAPMWGLYLAWFQITAVYLSTATGKAKSVVMGKHSWLTGDAFYNALHSKQYSVVFLTKWIDVPASIARPFGWLVLANEYLVPLAFWHRRTRPFAIAGMVFLHLGASMTMRVTILFQGLLLAQALLFLSNEKWERLYVFLGITNENGEKRTQKA